MDLLTEPYGYGPLARTIAALGLVAVFAWLQLGRALIVGRLSGFEPFGPGRAARETLRWRCWRREEGGEFWLIVGLYSATAIGCTSLAYRQLPDLSPSAAPSGLEAICVAPGVIDLSWAAPPRKVAASYYLLFRGNGQVPQELEESAAIARLHGTNLRDEGLAASTTFHYIVAAKYRWEPLAFSNEASETTPAAALENVK